MSISSDSSKTAPSFSLDELTHEASTEKEYVNTKSFLMQCGATNDSLWTHLSELLKRVTEERPTNVIDYFEEYSRRLKEERFATVNEHLRDIYEPPKNLKNVKKTMDLLKSLQTTPEEEIPPEAPTTGESEESATATRKRGFLEQMNSFREAGVSLPMEECYAINMALCKLSRTAPVRSTRFWGKIFGLNKDYFVAECDLSEDETTKRVEEEIAEEERAAEEAAREAEEKEAEEQRNLEAAKEKAEAEELAKKQAEGEAEGGGEGDGPPLPPRPVSIRDTYKMPPEPKIPVKVEIVVPRERYNEGVNKKVFYVCNELGDEWIELPNLLPRHIITARKIKKYFTGDLDKVIVSYPDFNGTEREYLRAQIARISAATQISPLGFYTFHEAGEEEEEVDEEEEEETKSTYVENTEFEPITIKDLTDPTMAFWVHHTQHILKQGRTKWWGSKGPKGEEEEEAEEEEEEIGKAEEPELGPPLLTPLSEDVSLETTSPWSVRNTSLYTPENAMAFVSSNLWPGGYAFAAGKNFGNIYIGWGHKYTGHGYSPAPFPFPEDEYEVGPEIMEIDDPTPEAEEEWRLAHEKKPKKTEGEEEEEEEEEEEDDDED